jgi:hypothetical protein
MFIILYLSIWKYFIPLTKQCRHTPHMVHLIS